MWAALMPMTFVPAPGAGGSARGRELVRQLRPDSV